MAVLHTGRQLHLYQSATQYLRCSDIDAGRHRLCGRPGRLRSGRRPSVLVRILHEIFCSCRRCECTHSPLQLSINVPQGAGLEGMLSSRLLNTSLFASDAGRSALSAAIANMPFASSYIVASPPLLYPYVEGTTSVTPAWRTSLWHVSISRPNALSIVRLSIPIQLVYVDGQFLFNSTLDDRRSQYAQVNQHMQVFRDLTPGSGAYSVRLPRQDRGIMYSSSRVRTKAMCTSLIMNRRFGDPTTNDCCKSSRSSK